jgi:chromosome segregation ATPase
MERTYRGLGFDPAPGEPDSVSQAIGQLNSAAAALAEVPTALRRAGELSAGWRGSAAEAFRARLQNLPSGLDSRERALRRAAGVLERWAGVLSANLRRAEDLDQRALRLRRQLVTARDDLQDRQNAADLAATAASAASASTELAVATARVSELDSALADLLESARQLERDHLRAAEAFAAELAELRGTESDRPDRPAAADAPFARLVGETLGRASRTSGTLAGLLLPAAVPAASPAAGAPAALAAAIARSGGTSRR